MEGPKARAVATKKISHFCTNGTLVVIRILRRGSNRSCIFLYLFYQSASGISQILTPEIIWVHLSLSNPFSITRFRGGFGFLLSCGSARSLCLSTVVWDPGALLHLNGPVFQFKFHSDVSPPLFGCHMTALVHFLICRPADQFRHLFLCATGTRLATTFLGFLLRLTLWSRLGLRARLSLLTRFCRLAQCFTLPSGTVPFVF
mmetsp:Transcript_26891/g.65298  ORF Transcript_26891/g.65298 Transcript_26891/m.65298 type:complete len:202 (-) Transcript_26891:871-1476(-)